MDLTVSVAPQPVRAEGRQHLLYELHITNFGRAALTLRRLDVLADSSSAAVVIYAGDSLAGVLTRPGFAQLPDKRAIGPGLRAVAFIEVIVPDRAAVPRVLRHRLSFDTVTPPNAPPQSVIEGGLVRVDTTAPLVLGAPVVGAGWIVLNGLSNASSHRRTILAIDGRARIAQRYAIDWSRVDSTGQVFHGDPSKNSNWVPYGSPILAVADASVVAIQDGIRENDPTSDTKAAPITLTTVGGNYIILDLGRGHYAFYAHLQPGSLCVRAGDRVQRGAMLAKLGNSGQSDAPHLHFQLMNAAEPLAAEGMPSEFARFDILGRIASLGVLTNGAGWHASEAPRPVTREIPMQNAVVAFPARRASSCTR